MSGYDPARYGDSVGDYDALYGGSDAQSEAAVQMLTELTKSQSLPNLLEFGIGTGRLAVPLLRRGIDVSGIDASRRMVEMLNNKLVDGERVPVVIGDYRDSLAPGQFSTVVLALNAIFDPRGRQAQLDIVANAARHLVEAGILVIETWVAHDDERNGEWSIHPRYVADQHVELQLARFDLDSNAIERTLVHLRPEGIEFVKVTDTYASPGELDVIAHVNGFDRIGRYGSWTRDPFTAVSSACISLYAKR